MAVYIHPDADALRSAPKLMAAVPGDVWSNVDDALHNYNGGRWAACVSACRRLLDDAYNHLTPRVKGRDRFQIIERAKRKYIWGDRVAQAAHALRRAGKYGAHSDRDTDVTHEYATAMLDLALDLTNFAFGWSGEIEELDKQRDVLENRR